MIQFSFFKKNLKTDPNQEINIKSTRSYIRNGFGYGGKNGFSCYFIPLLNQLSYL